MCKNGLDLNPRVLTCGYSGLFFGFISLKNVILLILLGGVAYLTQDYLKATFYTLQNLVNLKPLLDKFSSLFSKEQTKG